MSARLAAALAALAILSTACSSGATPRSAPASPSLPAAPASGPATPSCPASAALPAGANDHGARPAAGPAATIEADDTFFTPTCLTGIHPGDLALAIRNAGSALHNLSVPGQAIDTDVEPGTTVTVDVKIGAAAVPFFCKYHRASGMVGSLLPAGSGG